MKTILALDLGTSRCKAAILDEEGNTLVKHINEYDIIFPRDGYAEQDANQVWQMVKKVIKIVVSRFNQPETIRGISFSVQGEAVMPINKKGEPLHRVILGMDTRCTEENDYLREVLGEEELYYLTGMPVHTVNTLPKILWLKKNEREIFNKAWKFVLYEDFLTMKMCGEPVIDTCLASRTQMYDIKSNTWSEKILEAIGISSDRLSRVVESGQIIGEMKADLIKEFNLTAPVYLVAGGHDQACAALGSGVINDFDAMDSVGTAEVVEVATESLKLDKSLMNAKISTYRHVVPGMYLTMTLNHTAGLLVRWFIDNFFQEEVRKAREKNIDKYSYIIGNLQVKEPSYKLVLPHFNGSGTPWVKDGDYGLFMGLTLKDNKYTFLKAILEGLVYELKINLEILKKSGYHIKELITVGGGAKSESWMKIRASILNRKLISSADKDGAILGAFILAANAVDIFPTIKEGAQYVNKKAKKNLFEPAPELTGRYQELFKVYSNIYPQINGLNEMINRIRTTG